MPNWKKLISSGSSANLSKLNVDTSVTASFLSIGQLTYPSVTGSTGQFLTSDVSGNIVYQDPLEGSNSGSFSGSFFGNGSGLTDLKVNQATSLSSNFTNVLSQSFEHFFESTNVNVTIYDENEEMIIPQKVKILNSSSLEVFFDVETSGRAVLTYGGHIIEPYILSSDLTLVSSSFVSQSSVSVGHMFNSKNINVTVYDDNDYQLLPKDVYLTDNNNVRVDFSKQTSGTVVVTKGGHVLSGSLENATRLNGQTFEHVMDYRNHTNIPNGIVSSSNQISELTTFRAVVSGSTSYIITHSLNYSWPIVQCYRGDVIPQRQVQPNDVISLSGVHAQVTFTTPFVGSIVFKR